MSNVKTNTETITVKNIEMIKDKDKNMIRLVGNNEEGLDVEVDIPNVSDKFKIVTKCYTDEVLPGVKIVTSYDVKLEITILQAEDGSIYSVKDKKREGLIRSLDQFVELGFITEASKECIIDKCKNNDDLKKSIELLGNIFIKID